MCPKRTESALDSPSSHIHHGHNCIVNASIGERGHLGVIPGRVEKSGGSAKVPEEHPQCASWFHLVHDCRGILYKGEDCRDILLQLEGRQVYVSEFFSEI